MSSELSPEERQRLDTLFERAADLPPAEHAAFVERECGASGALREELGRLLAGLTSEDVLGSLQPGAPLRAGTKIGPYTLLERIGQGGMGEVYAAEQREPIHRRVALKIIKPGMGSGEVVARFHAERQALARMAHPHIAQVFDAGATDDGRPYLVMEHVAGDSITAYCDRRKLSTRQRLELFIDICDGVQHAHQKGIIHRDLKPSNLLVAQQDGGACAKIIDFGVARAVTGRLAERTLHTMLGQVVGTLDYMSPEQADPSAVDIDTRSDIYSLGVVLYELVSGLLPFEHSSSGTSPLSDIVRTIRERDPPTPSTRLRRATSTATTISPLHGTDPRSLIRQLSGDLDWICLKALEKDPARRYASASELAEDVRRHLAHQPVLAGRPGALYRARKFVRRNRVGVAAFVLVLIASCVGIGGIVAGRLEALASEKLASAAIDSERVVGFEVTASVLWPPYPEKIGDMEYWLSRARSVVDQLPQYRELLVELRGRARSDHAAEPRPDVDTDEERQEAVLVRLIERGEQLRSGLLAEDAVLPGHGWSVPKRLAFAHDLARLPKDGEYATAWATARHEIPLVRADLDGDGVEEEVYPSLDLQPQVGLVPLGPDPDSGLWEFGHLMTGAPAKRDPVTKKLVLTEAMGLVMVLIPGTFDPRLGIPVGKVRGGKLLPYFLSKYEMTQGQWQRLTGQNPSAYGPDAEWDPQWLSPRADASLLHPVEQVSWWDCDTWLSRAGLSLPSEAQWNRGARGGTWSKFWSGGNLKDLEGVANVRDEYFKQYAGEPWGRYDEDFNDLAAKHWEVGRRKPNAFGLHEVHGNVWEWCLDSFTEAGTEDSLEVDPVATESSDLIRMYRGGSFRFRAAAAGFDARFFDPPSFSGSARGVRPARAIF